MKLASFAVGNRRGVTATSKVASRPDEFSLGGRITAFRSSSERFYKWDTDFPMSLQKTKPDGESEFDLEFEMVTSVLARNAATASSPVA